MFSVFVFLEHFICGLEFWIRLTLRTYGRLIKSFMQTIFKWDSLPLTQLSRSTNRGQFEQIVIDSHLTERPPFQLMAQSQSRCQCRCTCSWAHSVVYVLRLKIYWSIVNIIKYIFQVLSQQCQLLAFPNSSSSTATAATSLPRWTVKIDSMPFIAAVWL